MRTVRGIFLGGSSGYRKSYVLKITKTINTLLPLSYRWQATPAWITMAGNLNFSKVWDEPHCWDECFDCYSIKYNNSNYVWKSSASYWKFRKCCPTNYTRWDYGWHKRRKTKKQKHEKGIQWRGVHISNICRKADIFVSGSCRTAS